MPLSLDDSAAISSRLEKLMRAYEASDYLTVIQDGETLESSLAVEDWNDINFVYLKLLLYCAHRYAGDGGDSRALEKAASRRQEMLGHNADPECNPLSFRKGTLNHRRSGEVVGRSILIKSKNARLE